MKAIDLFSLKEAEQNSTHFPKVINPQLYAFKHRKSILVYSPMSHSAAKLTHSEYTFLKHNKRINGKKQAEAQFEGLVNSFLYQNWTGPTRENVAPEKTVGLSKFLDGIEVVSLIFTTMCNLRCKYCAVFGGEPAKLSQVYSDPGIVKRQILDTRLASYVLGKIRPKLLHIYGWGEPTMAFNRLKDVLDTVDTDSMKIRIDTNGVYFGRREEIIKYFMEKKAFLQLSFDGLPILNDKHRVLPNGSSSTDEVLKTVAEINKYGKFGNSAIIRVTIAKGEENKIMDSVKYLAGIGVDLASFDPVESTGRAANSNVQPPDLNKMATNLVTAQTYARSIGFRLLSSMLPLLEQRSMEEYGCGYVGGNALGIGMNGDIYACVMPVPGLKIGSAVKTGKGYKLRFNMPGITHILVSRNVKNLKNCDACPVKCGGGCAARVYDRHGALEAEEAAYVCDAKRLALREYITSVLD